MGGAITAILHNYVITWGLRIPSPSPCFFLPSLPRGMGDWGLEIALFQFFRSVPLFADLEHDSDSDSDYDLMIRKAIQPWEGVEKYLYLDLKMDLNDGGVRVSRFCRTVSEDLDQVTLEMTATDATDASMA